MEPGYVLSSVCSDAISTGLADNLGCGNLCVIAPAAGIAGPDYSFLSSSQRLLLSVTHFLLLNWQAVFSSSRGYL